MKRIVAILFSFIPFIASAQAKLGITAGYHFSNIGRSDLIESHGIGNFSIGVFSEFRFNQSPVYLNGQVIYTTFGYGESNILASDNIDYTLGNIDLHRISYINVPVHIAFGAANKSMIIKGGIGPFIAFHIGDKMKIRGGGTFGSGYGLPLYAKRINPVLYGPSFQAGVQWPSFTINFHFSQSINGLYENESVMGPKWKIGAYGISIGYFISKKKK